MNHYTYIIQHKTEDKRYIGVRSSECDPVEDTSYLGSSKHLPSDVKDTHRKIILRTFQTRKEAIEHEILLHKVNNVSTNPSYYNKACQTSTGFDTTGTKLSFTEEHKKKISDSLKGTTHSDIHKRNSSISQKALYDNGYVNPRTGVIMDDTLKEKISRRKKELGCGLGTKNSRFTPWFIQHPNGIKEIFTDVTKEDKSLQDGFKRGRYQDLVTKSKGIKPMKSGQFKDYIFGNIVDDIV